MFNPSKEQVRQFFCGTWQKYRQQAPLTPLEGIALDWILQHPEYHGDLDDEQAAMHADYSVEAGRTNPFLHLAMHLSIAEQVQVDQPRGIRDGYLQLARRLDSEHDAAHEVMECLGEMLWRAQVNGAPPDGDTYVASVMQRATR